MFFFSLIKYIMLKENQLSTILLLVLVGFVIYKLMQPVTIKNTGAVEDSDDVAVVSEESSEEAIIEPEEVSEMEMMPAEQEEMGAGPVEDSEMEMIPEEIEDSEMEMQEESKGVNSFGANDLAEDGAGLEEAFQKPVGKKSSPDKVNFNKNMVDKYNSKDYLPQEVNDEWFETDFQQAKYKAGSDKMINTERYVIGVNTVGQSLKNPSYDIRGTIPNPKYTVSPWNNSTYEADYNLKPLC